VTAAKRIFLPLALAAVLAIAGCGGDDEGAPIPSETATALQAELDGVQARLDNGSAGACKDILEGTRGPNLDRVNQLIGALPDDVDPDVRAALEDSFDRLWELVQQDCDEKASEEEQQRQEQEQEEAEPEPTTPTTPEETTPTTPEEETPTTPEEDILPPEGDGENDGEIPPGIGNGNGVGNGGGAGPGNGQGNGQ
jgi:hypothetical protein